MSVIASKFVQKVNTVSDINEHLVTLYRYASFCDHVTECGVRGGVSSYAFANALKGRSNNKLVQVDPDRTIDIKQFQNECYTEGVNTIFYNESDLDCPMEDTDLLFIDTWHVYGQLKRELNRWNSSVKKYIIMHDTTVDEWQGETLRLGCDAMQQSKESGIPLDEITKGLWPAISEFLNEHPEWGIRQRFSHNNGLTILERV